MAYIIQRDIEDLFGIDNVAKWSNLDNDTTSADTARIVTAIDFADAYVDGKLRDGRYAIPITNDTVLVSQSAAMLAGWWLYRTRGMQDGDGEADKLTASKEMADELLSDIRSGLIKLDAPQSLTQPTAPTMVT